MSGPAALVAYSLAGGFIPAAIWLWFWLKEDRRHPEPTRLLVRVFLAGGLAVIVAYFLERLACNLNFLEAACRALGYAYWPINHGATTKILLLLWAAIEEGLKLLVVYLIVFRRPEFDEPVDAMIYLVTAAVGFAALENSLFLFKSLNDTGSGTVFLLTGNLRFLGANLVHIVSSAILGGFIAITFKHRRWERWSSITLGLITAIILHALFNLLIIIGEDGGLLKILTLLWLFAILIIWLFEKVKKQYV